MQEYVVQSDEEALITYHGDLYRVDVNATAYVRTESTTVLVDWVWPQEIRYLELSIHEEDLHVVIAMEDQSKYTQQRACVFMDYILANSTKSFLTECSHYQENIQGVDFEDIPQVFKLPVCGSVFKSINVHSKYLDFSDISLPMSSIAEAAGSRFPKQGEEQLYYLRIPLSDGLNKLSWVDQQFSKGYTDMYSVYLKLFPIESMVQLVISEHDYNSQLSIDMVDRLNVYIASNPYSVFKYTNTIIQERSQVVLPSKLARKCSIDVHDREILGLGLHRKIVTRVKLNYSQKRCFDLHINGNNVSFGIIETIPFGAYVDLYELEHYRDKGTEYLVMNNVDIEKPSTFGIQNHVFVMKRNLLMSDLTEVEFIVPFHVRYHSPSILGSRHQMFIMKPLLYFRRTSSKLSEAYVEPIFLNSGLKPMNWSNSLQWLPVEATQPFKSLLLELPVGNLRDKLLVNIVTYMSIIIASTLLVVNISLRLTKTKSE